jgi:copper transport protein
MRYRRFPFALVALLVGTLLASGPAAAHAQYVSSTPAQGAILTSAPTQVSVTLSEAIQGGTGTIRVTNETGAPLNATPVSYSADARTISAPLGAGRPGIYTVTWTAVSAVDGHFTAGSFSYGVQDRNGNLNGTVPGQSSTGAPVSPLEVALRSLGFLGLAIVTGVGVMANFMWLPAGRDPDARASRAYGLAFSVLLNVGRIAAFAFAASMAGLLALATGLEGTSAAQGLLASPYLESVAIRVALGGGLFVLLSRAFARSRTESPEKSVWTIQASLVLGVAAVIASSIGTHAAAAPVFAAVGVAADAAHFGGIGLWFGGLAGIVAVRSFFREPEAAPLARIVLGRFSRLAAYAVALVLGGGIVLSLLLVGTWEALVGTAYGWVVLGKIALFAPMVALGAFNRYRLLPETAEADKPAEAVRRIVGNVRFETALGIAVLVLAGLLTTMTPAASVASATPNVFALDIVKDGLRAHFETYPYPTTVGVYTLTIILSYDSNNTPFLFARNGTIQFTLWDPQRPPGPKQNLSGPHGDHFFITTTDLASPGLWKIDTNFQRLDGFDLRATFYVPIKAGG